MVLLNRIYLLTAQPGSWSAVVDIVQEVGTHRNRERGGEEILFEKLSYKISARRPGSVALK